MTNDVNVTTVCNGCGKEKEGRDQFQTFYEPVEPNNEHVLEKTHYCDDCEEPDEAREKHPVM